MYMVHTLIFPNWGIGIDYFWRGNTIIGCHCIVVGCSEMLMTNAVQLLAAKIPGKESMAMEAFARALRKVRVTNNRWLWQNIYTAIVADNNC